MTLCKGWVQSPNSFNFYTKTFLDKLKNWLDSERIISNLRYANDTMLLAESDLKLQDLVKQVNRTSTMF